MRTGLTQQQTNIINATVKKVSWLFEIDRDNDGTVDYYWSLSSRAWNGHNYTYKIMSFTSLILDGGTPELGIIASTNITIQASFSGSNIAGVYASAFEGASITVRLISSTDADGEAELMSWRFTVVTATSVDQVLTLECQDWFTLKLEGDYPNTPLVSELFPATIMKNDNVCVPIVFGEPFFPIRWITKTWTAYPGGVNYFTLGPSDGDQTALFAPGQFVLVDCGSDGLKSGWVDHSSLMNGGSGPYTQVNLTSASDPLTANTNKAQTDHYVLGPAAPTYTIDRARTPQQVNFKTTYRFADYTFKQDTLKASDGVNYKVMQLLCDDANKDGTNDANGFWGVIGKEIYDLPCRFSSSDLVATTNPADIASRVFQDWGIPASEIDDTSRAAAAAIFTARSFNLNIGLWYRLTREEFISKLFTLSGMIPVYRNKIGFKVLTKTPQMNILEDMIDPGSFKVSRTYTQKQTDSGYVTWQTADNPVDQVQKCAVAVKSTMNNRSDTTIEAEWILDSVKAQKAGKLALQRILLRDKTITFTANSKILALEPGDMITISPQNLGAEGSSYTCQISKMTIREGLWVDVECIRFSDSLDDWDDLTASDIVVSDANTDRSCSPVYQGPTDAASDTTGNSSANIITQTVQIGAGGVLATNSAPQTNGGFQATDSALTCYNSAGKARFQAKYGSDPDQGDVVIGDYDGGRGIKWDQGDSKLYIKVDAAGGVSVSGGGDITLTGSDTDPGRIKFSGTSYATEMGADASGAHFVIRPDTNAVTDINIGTNGAWWGDADSIFRDIRMYASRQGFLTCGDWAGAVNGAAVEVIGDSSQSEPAISFTLYDKTTQAVCQYHVRMDYFRPLDHKKQDLGGASAAWDDAYADDWHNVADFFFLDHRREGDVLTPVNDVEVIKAIKPSGVFDPRTGLEIIDDNTLPGWLLSKDKVSGKALYDKDGKPYLSLKAVISLCLGAIRQLDREKEVISHQLSVISEKLKTSN